MTKLRYHHNLTEFCAPMDAERFILTFVHVRDIDGELTVEATDGVTGIRVVSRPDPELFDNGDEVHAIVRADMIKEALRTKKSEAVLKPEEDGGVRISFKPEEGGAEWVAEQLAKEADDYPDLGGTMDLAQQMATESLGKIAAGQLARLAGYAKKHGADGAGTQIELLRGGPLDPVVAKLRLDGGDDAEAVAVVMPIGTRKESTQQTHAAQDVRPRDPRDPVAELGSAQRLIEGGDVVDVECDDEDQQAEEQEAAVAAGV